MMNNSNKKQQRTIQVKIGNQAARAMTPDQAADYLKSIASKGWGAGRELKMTFDNGSTSTVSLPRASTTTATSVSTSTTGSFDRSSSRNNNNSSNDNNNNNNNNNNNSNTGGMPCSEKEMKALMSMFVEIMGLQMNTDRLNQVKNTTASTATKSTTKNNKTKSTSTSSSNNNNNNNNTDSSNLFHFPADLPPPPGGWPDDLMWPNKENNNDDNNKESKNKQDNDDDDDFIPELEEIPENERDIMIQKSLENLNKINNKNKLIKRNILKPGEPIPPVPGTIPTPPIDYKTVIVTGKDGIVPFEWSALERSAIEDALEQEERIRKDSTKNNKNKNNNNATTNSPDNNNNKNINNNNSNKININNNDNNMNNNNNNNNKSNKNNNNNNNNKSNNNNNNNAQMEAAIALKKVEAANKKLSKAVTIWRNRVATSVIQNEIHKLNTLLSESPLPAVTNLQQQAATALLQSTQQQQQQQYHNIDKLKRNTINSTQNNNNNSSNNNNNPHLEFLIPLTVPKNFNNSTNKSSETRGILAKYILKEFSSTYYFNILDGRNGRSAVHTACMYADNTVLALILEKTKNNNNNNNNKSSNNNNNNNNIDDLLLTYCQDSGWTALHYAVLSGSYRTVELILKYSNNPISLLETSTTNITHTWKKGHNKKGIVVTYLLEAVITGKYDKMIETHGMALSEIINHHYNKVYNNNNDGYHNNYYTIYTEQLKFILDRINNIIKNNTTYKSLSDKELNKIEKQIERKYNDEINNNKQKLKLQQEENARNNNNNNNKQEEEVLEEKQEHATNNNNNVATEEDNNEEEESPTSNKSKKKKKKKKKKGNAANNNNNNLDISENSSSVIAAKAIMGDDSSRATTTTDPLVAALLGMGFAEKQVMAGIDACGGMSRATADDVVAWIFSGGTEETTTNTTIQQQQKKTSSSEETPPAARQKKEGPKDDEKKATTTTTSISVEEAERRNLEAARQKEEERLAAERAAAKREEQRRRNREWNNRQARQAQEAGKAAASQLSRGGPAPVVVTQTVPGLRTGLAGASNFIPNNTGVRGPSPTFGLSSSSQVVVPGARPKPAPSSSGQQQQQQQDPSRKATTARLVGGLNLGPSRSDVGVENAFSNDASTVASSVDHGVIEIRENDDATVSTMGSFPAVQQQQQQQPSSIPPANNNNKQQQAISLSFAPPGFSSGEYDQAQQQQQQNHDLSVQQWDTTHRSFSFNEGNINNNNNNNNAYSALGGTIQPPGIPESSPLLDDVHNHAPAFRSHSMNDATINLPTSSNDTFPMSNLRLDNTTGPVAGLDTGMSGLLGGPAYSNDINPHRHSVIGGVEMGPSLLSGGFSNPAAPPLRASGGLERATSVPLMNNAASGTTTALPGLIGFGSDSGQNQLESSIIDSISTGNTAIGGTSLWGNSNEQSQTAAGSSLLGSLFSDHRDFHADSSSQSTSLFSTSTFQRQNPNPHNQGSWGQQQHHHGNNNNAQNNNNCGNGNLSGGSIW